MRLRTRRRSRPLERKYYRPADHVGRYQIHASPPTTYPIPRAEEKREFHGPVRVLMKDGKPCDEIIEVTEDMVKDWGDLEGGLDY